MPLYSYTGKNEKSERVHGSINANDIVLAKQQLSSKGIVPEEVFQISYDSTTSPKPENVVPPTRSVIPEEKSKQQVVSKNDTNKQVLKSEETTSTKTSITTMYYPISDTLRLYAGWLLAWYGLVYALGSYQSTRELSFEVPYLMGIYYSPLVLSFTLGSFLFLLLSGVHRITGRGIISGFFLSILGVALFSVYRMNV